MATKLLLHCILIFCVCEVSASNTLTKGQIAEINQLLDSASKQDCINYWTANQNLTNALFEIGSSVSEQCKCVTEEVSYLMTSEEKASVAVAFAIYGNSNSNKREFDMAKITLDTWLSNVRNIRKLCFSKSLPSSKK